MTNPVSGNPVNQQSAALQGDWRRVGYPAGKIGWEALADEVGLKRYYGGVPYSLASSYTHSLAISAFQVGEAYDLDEQRRLHHSALWYGASFHACLLQTYVKIYDSPEVRAVYEPLEAVVKFWMDMGNSEIASDSAA